MWYVCAFAYTRLGLASTTRSEGLNVGTRSAVTSSGLLGTPWSSRRLKLQGAKQRSEIFHNLTVLSAIEKKIHIKLKLKHLRSLLCIYIFYGNNELNK